MRSDINEEEAGLPRVLAFSSLSEIPQLFKIETPCGPARFPGVLWVAENETELDGGLRALSAEKKIGGP